MKKHLLNSIKIILFVAIFALIMKAMNFCLVSSNWASIGRWEEYSKSDDYDTLFVGSSVGWVIVPRTIDGLNGSHCVNMSTPDQFYKTSLSAVKFVSKQQPLDKVVLLTGFDALGRPEEYTAAASFLEAEYETAPELKRYGAIVADKAGRYGRYDFLSSTDSINIWFDWVERFTYTMPQIFKNVAYRMERRNPGYVLDMSEKIGRVEAPGGDPGRLDTDVERAEALGLSSLSINRDSLEMLDEMAAYLKANDIRFAVIVTPHRSDVKEGYGDEYGVIDSYLKDFVTERGGEYYNIDNDEALRERLPDDMFMDTEHIVDQGNDLVSEKIAELLR